MREIDLIENDIDAFLKRDEKKELLRFVTVGSVDDGKSTLIGRLLHDTKGVYEDQLKDAVRTTETGETAIDFARITDGLRAEREQGITIDVAYRYFATPRRKFIIADTPGHVQYTRNMATGASTAHVGLILIDARLGVLTQSRRHGYIGSLLRIPHLLVCVNKMDLVDYDEGVYEAIKAEFKAFTDTLNYQSVNFIPVSALMGSNVVDPSPRTPWYDGPTVLDYLETVELNKGRHHESFRLPVQYVLRPNLNYRGFAGQIVSGVLQPGDEIMVQPSGKTSKVAAIDTLDGELAVAQAPQSVVVRLEDEIDISRGDVLVHPDQPAQVSRYFDAMVVWMSEESLDPRKSYWIKHGTQYIRVNVEGIDWEMDLEKIQEVESSGQLVLNDIGRVRLSAHRPIPFDAYGDNRSTGAFIFIDTLTNVTVGAGMIIEPRTVEAQGSLGPITAEERAQRLGHKGAVVWLAGQQSRSHVEQLERAVFEQGVNVFVASSADDASLLASAGLVALAWGEDREEANGRILDVAENASGEDIVSALRSGEILV